MEEQLVEDGGVLGDRGEGQCDCQRCSEREGSQLEGYDRAGDRLRSSSVF